MVETFGNIDNILTQGFQQPEDFSISVEESPEHSLMISVFPNPVISELSVSLQSEKKRKFQLLMVDMIGNKIRETSFEVSPGANTHTLDVSNLAQGVYFLQVESRGILKTVRFVKN